MKKSLSTKLNLLVILLTLININTFSQPAGNKVIRLYEGAAPGSEDWTWNESEKNTGKQIIVIDVSVPTLTVFAADKSIATGTAVVICPGGGFRMLSMTNEGYDVAKWLNSKGITAFVLKYRLSHVDTTNKGNLDRTSIAKMAIADGKAAMTYVRNQASEWGLKRIGIMGFSAGGVVACGVTLSYDAQSRPDFVASIYAGKYLDADVPSDAPPMFIAVASDDSFNKTKQCIDLYYQWVDAKKSAELHIYRKGGHGFGMTKHNIPTDGWIDRFYEWLIDLKL